MKKLISSAGKYVSVPLILLFVAVIGCALYGWVENIIKLIHIVDGGITGMFVLRVVGIFMAPLGALLGFF